MHAKDFFVNHHSEIRVGWRFLSFAGYLLLLQWLIPMSLRALGVRDDFVARMLGLSCVLGGSYVWVRLVNRKTFGAIGLLLHPQTFRELGMGCLIGFLMMTGIFVVEIMTGYVQASWRTLDAIRLIGTVSWAFVFFAVAAMLEEVVFRGYLFQTLIQWITFLPATVLMSSYFAFNHAHNPNATALGIANVGLAGVWLSVAYMKTRGLWLPVGLHFAWNFSQTALYGFPTSGISFADLRSVILVQTGPEWVTGGAFGPEGGMLATLALVISIWYILKSKNLNAPEGMVTLDSVEDLLPAANPEGSQSV